MCGCAWQVTTSSCSGRIVLYKAPNPFCAEHGDGKMKGEGGWIVAEHGKVETSVIQSKLSEEWELRGSRPPSLVRATAG